MHNWPLDIVYIISALVVLVYAFYFATVLIFRRPPVYSNDRIEKVLLVRSAVQKKTRRLAGL